MEKDLTNLGFEVKPGCANFFLVFLKNIDSTIFIEECRKHGVYLRNASNMCSKIGNNCVRIAVKNNEDNQSVIHIMNKVKNLLNRVS